MALIRAVDYSRYSTDKQRLASIADQQELNRRYIVAKGWAHTGSYDDPATSGDNQLRRPGFLRMVADAEAGRFDVVVCEAPDRLARKLSNLSALHDRLTFVKVEMHAVKVGHLTPMHIAIMGVMAQMFLSDLRDKVRRGQLGRAIAGRMPGGLAYGYDVVPPPPGATESGERRINEAEAAIVRRIFEDYANGASPRTIAKTLNEVGVPGPGGRPWIDTTIRGQVDRGTGLLNNTVYAGELQWDRCSYVKNPQTGLRVARVNPISQREITAVPHLRIIDQVLWDRVKARQAEARLVMPTQPVKEQGQPNHRHKFLLSGLLTCGICGGGYTMVGASRYGCANRRSKGTCGNSCTITRQAIEARVLGSLQSKMLEPELVAEFVRGFAEECARHNKDRAQASSGLERERAAVERSLAGILRAIEDGAWSESLRARLAELEARKAAITEKLAETDLPALVALHPNAAGLYAARVAALVEALNEPAMATDAIEAIRCLIHQIVLTPEDGAPNGLSVDLHGDLALILSLASGTQGVPIRRRSVAGAKNEKLPAAMANAIAAGSQLTVVAGIGFEPMTFRL